MMETRKIYCGTKFFGPKVDITDPCYNRDVWCRMNDVEVVEGDYECDIWMYDGSCTYDGETHDDTRVAVLGIYLGGDIPDPEEFEEIGDIGVDAGLAGIFNSPKPDFDDDEWAHFCKEIDHQNAIINDNGFCSVSGYGDGCYGVFAAKDESGNIVALEIRFIEADDMEDEDDE